MKRKYSQIACWMMAFGKRKPWYGDVKPNLTKPAIVLVAEGGTLAIEVHGDLAAILALGASGSARPKGRV